MINNFCLINLLEKFKISKSIFMSKEYILKTINTTHTYIHTHTEPHGTCIKEQKLLDQCFKSKLQKLKLKRKLSKWLNKNGKNHSGMYILKYNLLHPYVHTNAYVHVITISEKKRL